MPENDVFRRLYHIVGITLGSWSEEMDTALNVRPLNPSGATSIMDRASEGAVRLSESF